MTEGRKHHRVDLVFYHRLLRCHVLIDLKMDVRDARTTVSNDVASKSALERIRSSLKTSDPISCASSTNSTGLIREVVTWARQRSRNALNPPHRLDGLSFTGGTGEVEDYRVGIQQAQQLDFGDAPDSYGTLLGSNGPRHTITGPRLGSLIDVETNGNPRACP